MTDTKVVVARNADNRNGRVLVSYDRNALPGMCKITAIRTLSSAQSGVLAFNYGVNDITYSSQDTDGVYTGTISSITSTISDHVYTLELSNIFGNILNPTLVYDTTSIGNVREPNVPEVYTDTMYFNQANVAESPLVFGLSGYTGPTNTVQLNFYNLITDPFNVYQKSGDPINFVV